jgi:hypothetical protein
MNGNHWTDYTEAQLALMRAGGTVHASHAQQGPPRVRIPDVTAETRRVLVEPYRAALEPETYPPEWLPEVAARAAVRATQTPAEWMRDNGPDPAMHRNGTAPQGSPGGEAYPANWLTEADLRPPGGGLGGEGFLNRRRAA